ncbi:hypothetical protein LCM00_07605 [Bacillus infantis]|uniref:hypothetical protein n=1 Tax=Bacillus infantis TaxID=324767 RepID=UPI001CD4C7EF|nr:hypothetical protein [Bacillus infantis]MCA1039355.1 hypothetical protein [Bacillus infantis]
MNNRFQSADIDMMGMNKMDPFALIGLRLYYILHGKKSAENEEMQSEVNIFMRY